MADSGYDESPEKLKIGKEIAEVMVIIQRNEPQVNVKAVQTLLAEMDDDPIVLINYIGLDEYIALANARTEIIREQTAPALRHFVPDGFSVTTFEIFINELVKVRLEGKVGIVAHTLTLFKCATPEALCHVYAALSDIAILPWVKEIGEAAGQRLARIILLTATSKGCITFSDLDLHLPSSQNPPIW